MKETLTKVAAAVIVPASILVTEGVSHADTIPANPMGTTLSDGRDDTVAWVMTYGVPALAGSVLFGILIRAGFKWFRKAGRAAAG